MRDRILIVRHGPGRGRIPSYGQHILDWIAAERPNLASHVKLHETGTGPADLGDVGAVFFWLADPLQIKYPACYEEALAIQQEAERRGCPVLNRPTSLAKYGKAVQSQRLSEAGVPTPQAVRVRDRAELRDYADEFGYPLLLRGDQSFSGEGTVIVKTERDLDSMVWAELPGSVVATPLIDIRAEFRKTEKGSLWAHCFHKKRVLVIGNQCVADSLYFSRTPVVGPDTSIYARVYRRQSWLRRRGRLGRRAAKYVGRGRTCRQALEFEREFVESPVQQADFFLRAASALELDFAGIDFASLPGGRVILWEANPYPFIPSVKSNLLSRSRRSAEKLLGIYQAFAKCLEGLLDSDLATPVLPP